MDTRTQEEMFLVKFYDNQFRMSMKHGMVTANYQTYCQSCLIVERLSGKDITDFRETFVYKVGVQCHKCLKRRMRK